MFKKSLNMIYSNKVSFFSQLSLINKSVSTKKQSSVEPIGTEKDKVEIERGDGYAIFEEFRNGGKELSLNSMREALTDKRVTDTSFQNKILFMLLQHRGGIQFRVGQLISEMLMADIGLPFGTSKDYQLDLEVNGPTDVTLVIRNQLTEKDPYDSSKVTLAFETTIRVNITPDMVSISDFELEQKAETRNATQAFKFLEDNHQNFLERLLSYIRHVFGYDSELRIENSNDSTAVISP